MGKIEETVKLKKYKKSVLMFIISKIINIFISFYRSWVISFPHSNILIPSLFTFHIGN